MVEAERIRKRSDTRYDTSLSIRLALNVTAFGETIASVPLQFLF